VILENMYLLRTGVFIQKVFYKKKFIFHRGPKKVKDDYVKADWKSDIIYRKVQGNLINDKDLYSLVLHKNFEIKL
jgi:hypothetical protein